MNRKQFLKSMFGCIASSSCLMPLVSFSDNHDETQKYLYHRYVAEKYVDTTVNEFTENDRHYFAVAPVGFVKSPDGRFKDIIEIPSRYRRIFCKRYDLNAREQLIQQMIEFFKTEKTGTFIDQLA